MERKKRKILRSKQTQELVGLGPTTIYRKEKAGEFPQRVQLGPHAVGWYEDEVIDWINSRPRGMADAPDQALAGQRKAGG